jgi:P2-related tail formation protein
VPFDDTNNVLSFRYTEPMTWWMRMNKEVPRTFAEAVRLRDEMAKTPPGDKAVLEMVRRIQDARRTIRQKDEEVEAVLETVLTPVQRGRYIIFSVDFLRSMGESLGRKRRGPGVY